MANEQNLTRKGKEIDSTEKAQRLGSLGGVASGKSKRDKKKYQKLIDKFGSLKINYPEIKLKLKSIFNEIDDELTADEAVVLRQYEKAILTGNTISASFIRNTRGEMPVIKKAQTDTDGEDVPIIKDDIK